MYKLWESGNFTALLEIFDMTIHCKLGDNQAIVSYKFSNTTIEILKIKNVPIEVETYRIPDSYAISGSVKPPGQVQTFRSFSGIRSYTLAPPGSPDDSHNDLTLTMYYHNEGSEFVYARRSELTITESGGTDCGIRIFYNSVILFEEVDKCPCDYTVTCGEECPPGTTKCASTNYPGYCCLPCDSTKQEIISIKNIVKKVNKKPVSYG